MRRFLHAVSPRPIVRIDRYVTLLNEALPVAASDEVTGLDLSPYDDLLFTVKDASPSANAGIYLELGDATDYTTNVTLDGVSIDDNGAALWSTTGGLAFTPIVGLASTMVGGFRMSRLPTAIAEAFYGSGWNAWQVQGIIGASTAGDINRMGGIFATNKTVDRARISVTTGNFDNGSWAGFAK